MNISFEKLKHIRLRQSLYPLILVCFFSIVAILFFRSASFISNTINSSLTIDEQAVEDDILKVDLATYYAIAKKLNIPTPSPSQGSNTPLPTTPSPLSKSALQIAVYNSTSKTGLASQLETVLIKEGFPVAKTGNQSPVEKTTLIKVKTGRVSEDLANELEVLVKARYSSAIRQAAETSSQYDVEIVIGND